MSQDNN